MKNNKKCDKPPAIDVSSIPEGGVPEDAFDIINRYGTYNIQPTSDTDNMYPTIAQGFNKKIIDKDCQNKNPGNQEY